MELKIRTTQLIKIKIKIQHHNKKDWLNLILDLKWELIILYFNQNCLFFM